MRTMGPKLYCAGMPQGQRAIFFHSSWLCGPEGSGQLSSKAICTGDGVGEMWAGLQGTMWHREGSACSLETHRSGSAEQCECYQSAHGLISEHRGVLSRNAGEYLETGHLCEWVENSDGNLGSK